MATPIRCGSCELVLDLGWDPNHQEDNAAIHSPAGEGDEDMVRLLLSRGASVTLRDPWYDGTAVGWADFVGRIATPLWSAWRWRARPKLFVRCLNTAPTRACPTRMGAPFCRSPSIATLRRSRLRSKADLPGTGDRSRRASVAATIASAGSSTRSRPLRPRDSAAGMNVVLEHALESASGHSGFDDVEAMPIQVVTNELQTLTHGESS